MDETHKRIGLLDHMGFGNMGDAAIQESFIANIHKRLPNALLIGFSLYPDDTRKRHNIESHPITWCYPGWKHSDIQTGTVVGVKSALKSVIKRWQIVHALAATLHHCIQEILFLLRSYRIVRSLDILIMSGGGQLCELYGPLPYNVFKFCVLAKLSRTPVFLVGVGADLLKRPYNRFFAKWSVRLANYTSFRSLESQALIVSLGVKKETHVCPDPAYALDIRDYVASRRSDMLTTAEAQALLRNSGCTVNLERRVIAAAPERVALKIGLNPIGFCDPRRWPRRDEAVYRRYLDNFATFSTWALGQGYHLENIQQ